MGELRPREERKIAQGHTIHRSKTEITLLKQTLSWRWERSHPHQGADPSPVMPGTYKIGSPFFKKKNTKKYRYKIAPHQGGACVGEESWDLSLISFTANNASAHQLHWTKAGWSEGQWERKVGFLFSSAEEAPSHPFLQALGRKRQD